MVVADQDACLPIREAAAIVEAAVTDVVCENKESALLSWLKIRLAGISL